MASEAFASRRRQFISIRSTAHSMAHSVRMLLLLLSVLLLSLSQVTDGSECSACGYLARNCSESNASFSVDVCDKTGGIQIDDVFCNDDECPCANGFRCVSTVVGCANTFQSRNRRRCVSNATLSHRFEKCAIKHELTRLNASNVASDWIYFKQGNKCRSFDCLAVQRFHQSGLVQCGHLLAVWKTDVSSTDVLNRAEVCDTMYHFIADGSRASDMKAGTFLYSVPWSSEALALRTEHANTKAIPSCYVLQTRNQLNGTCEGIYMQFDVTVQFANSDEYVMSKLSWPVWVAVVGSVASAVLAVVVVGVVWYRFHYMDRSIENGEDGGLLKERGNLTDHNDTSTSPSGKRGLPNTDLRQRGATDATQMEAGTATTTL
ncbi:hypothetical protein PsorP6_008250 [Peronosclerospora sorghi]|uniref:Uncharacterized protein n=1 Tax=Peronosclerospora sorghi TaxID=230839 RepID=A0ACC0W901_9STRA|nr:hypothetical protein PsorP6_008250 [Peronosclerospora sorghi]